MLRCEASCSAESSVDASPADGAADGERRRFRSVERGARWAGWETTEERRASEIGHNRERAYSISLNDHEMREEEDEDVPAPVHLLALPTLADFPAEAARSDQSDDYS